MIARVLFVMFTMLLSVVIGFFLAGLIWSSVFKVIYHNDIGLGEFSVIGLTLYSTPVVGVAVFILVLRLTGRLLEN